VISTSESVLPPSDRADFEEQSHGPAEIDLPDDNGLEDVHSLSININGNVVTKATAHLPADQKLLIRWLFAWALDNGLSWPELQERSGIHKSTLFRVFQGKYLYPSRIRVSEFGVKPAIYKVHPKAGLPIKLDGFCDKIDKLKSRIEKVTTLFSVGFLKTSVWFTMEWACGQAARKNKPVFLFSYAQVGKTAAAQEYAHQHNSGITTYIRIPPTGGVRSLLAAFARALHLNPKQSYDDLRNDIIESLDKSKLLILDELHEIFITSTERTAVRLMEEIRYIWDETHCGMVLIGTNVFKDAFEEAQFKRFLSQWKRRGLYEINLPAIMPDEDLAVALNSYGLPFTIEKSESFKIQLPVINEEGLEQDVRRLVRDGFGQLLTRLEDGKGYADKAGHAYTWLDFVKARNIVHKMTMKLEGKR
jgi:hypothetical protein